MGNPEHITLLKSGVKAWNERRQHFATGDLSQPDLRGAWLPEEDLREADLSKANLIGARLTSALLTHANVTEATLTGAHLPGANLVEAYLDEVDLTDADLIGADLRRAVLYGANLSGADLRLANLSSADLSRANLRGASLQQAAFVGTNLRGADLTGCRVYGISAWDLRVDKHTTQASLIITPSGQPEVSVDNLKIAQFVYLLLTNPEIRDVIDTVAKKAVLILGRFTDERKAVLDALRNGLREHGYVPILFDFEGPGSRDLTETITTLARLVRFVVADLTDPRSLPQEFEAFVKDLPSLPVQPLILEGQRPYAMFEHIARYPWVLPIYTYADQGALLADLEEHVITPAEDKAEELRPLQHLAR